MTTFRQFSQPLFAGVAAFALSLAMISGTVSVPHQTASSANTSMEYAA
ncbi:hypothetical protein [Novosphingobium cyanobacteriorum]|uniref:Uncharacterized protein n=1 Tax=Novosphingobium cyanobacteriorum TaxID=3024215 RepID=A0ABT6CME7_9SPHN|nr:hypothetical protein [Novosphingobium cyanobacteriorum]MDF8335037.1 hypothetical protein [Novosphingobium cyanobacteriorum]